MKIESDDNGNGVFGESGEYSGEVKLDVDEDSSYQFIPVYRVP
ncbi:MAG: hypothetical protein WD273_13980 [Trueperaceae bacterium]